MTIAPSRTQQIVLLRQVAEHAEVALDTSNLTDEKFSEKRSAIRGTGNSPAFGGSDAAAATGFSRWESPYSKWYRMTTDTPQEPTERMEAGKRLETVICDWAAEREGLRLMWHPQAIYRSRVHQWRIATPDRFAITADGTPCLVECKNTSLRLDSEWQNDSVPAATEIQVHHNMDVLGFGLALVCALIDGGELKTRWIVRDDKVASDLLAAESGFYHYVEHNIEFPVNGHKTTTWALSQRYPDGDIDEVIELFGTEANEFAEWCRQYRQRIEFIKTAENAKAEYGNRIRQVLGDAAGCRINGTLFATWRNQKNGTRVLRVPDPKGNDVFEDEAF